MPEQLVPLPFDSRIVNRLRGKSLVDPTGEDVRALCRMLDWCEERFIEMRLKLEDIVCTVAPDEGVVMLSQEGPTHYDAELKIQVYDHEYFSPLGDALIELHKLSNVGESSC